MDHLGRALLLAKLVVSSVTCIYIGAHGSIRRPPSAAPRKKGSRYGKGEEDRHIEGLTQSDAILFPVLAGTVLMGLYFLFQYLQDPAILNMIFRAYLSLLSVVSLSKLFSHSLQLAVSFIFPSYWRTSGLEESKAYRLDQRARRHVIVSLEPGQNSGTAVEFAHGPLPVATSRLPFSAKTVDRLWSLRSLLKMEWVARFKIHGVFDETAPIMFLDIVAFFLSIGTSLYYFTTHSNVASNLMGVAFCYSSSQFISPTTFVVGSQVLGALFHYDNVMVFYTPFMITVATKLDVPIKLTFTSGAMSNILGLGDIVVPGMMIGLALRFDLWKHYQQKIEYVPVPLKSEYADQKSGEVASTTQTQYMAKKAEYQDVTGKWGDLFWLSAWYNSPTRSSSVLGEVFFSKPYFHASMAGYVLGMFATLTMLMVFEHGQPALLYLVPGVLGSLWLTGWARGELGDMWNYTEDGSLDVQDCVVELDGEGKVIKEINDEKKDALAVTEKSVAALDSLDDGKDTLGKAYDVVLFSISSSVDPDDAIPDGGSPPT